MCKLLSTFCEPAVIATSRSPTPDLTMSVASSAEINDVRT